MKRFLSVAVVGLCLPLGTAQADPNGTVVGALVGTAAGLIIANNAHGVNPWVAAPVGALVGGYIGSQYDRDDAWRYRHGDDRYYDRDRDWHYGHDGHRHGYYRGPGYYPPPAPTVVYVEKKTAVSPAPTPPVDSTHPGVDLIKVSIMNSNGVRTDVPILRTGGKFVGPQGEEYEVLPTAEQLAKRYGM